MKNIYLLLSFFLLSFFVNAQINFENGYFINNENEKVECLIKNPDWGSNPDHFTYKLFPDSKPQIGEIANIKTFQIYNTVHFYKRFTVEIDENAFPGVIGNSENMTYKKGQYFFRVLLDGKASLYELRLLGQLYFYSVDNSNIEQLQYKKYKRDDNGIRENKAFQKQLFDNLECNTLTFTNFINLDYKKDDLIQVFSEYNHCQKSDFYTYRKRRFKGDLNLSFQIGLNSNAPIFEVERNGVQHTFSLNNKVTPSFGLEIEYILPFNRNKWSVYMSPKFQFIGQSSLEVSYIYEYHHGVLNTEYSYVELPFGARYYMFLDMESKLFMDISSGILFLTNNDPIMFNAPYTDEDNDNDIFEKNIGEANSFFNIGVGYTFKGKYTAEMIWSVSKKKSQDYYNINMNNSIRLMFGYIIF